MLMAITRVTHRLNSSEIDRILRSEAGPVARDLMRRGLLVESAAKRRISSNPMRVDTGRLRSSITHVLTTQGTNLQVRVGTNVFYALYIHDGTGIYGPRHRMIKPVRAQMLHWVGKSGEVFARQVRGIPPNPFLKDALPAAAG